MEETGVLSGMSGSPVYIDGRLIGAIAYRLSSFSKRPVAGVTPIADMLSVFEAKENVSNLGRLDLRENPEDVLKYGNSGSELAVLPLKDGFTTIEPIQTPVMMAGFNPEAIRDMSNTLEKFGMVPVQGGGASSRAR